jgi:hypothetical protein
VDHVAVRRVVVDFQVGDLERAHGVDGSREGSFGVTFARHPQPLSCRPQRAQHLRAIKTLPLTVVAKAHRSLVASSPGRYTSIFVFQASSLMSAV